MNFKVLKLTERSGSVVTHETRILEVPGLNPGADQPDWVFSVVFLNHEGKCWLDFHYHDPLDQYPSFSYRPMIKKSVSELNKETSITQQ